MTESLTLGSVHLVGEHMPTAVRVTVIDDLERPAGFLITTAQWTSLLALADTKLAGEREVERLRALLVEVIEKYEYVDHTFVPKFPANGGPTQSQRRIAEIRKEAGIEQREPGDGYCPCGERLDRPHHHGDV